MAKGDLTQMIVKARVLQQPLPLPARRATLPVNRTTA